MTAAIEDFGPGPLPVIKAICVELGMLDTLNEQLTWDEAQCNLSPAHRLLALIMNVLTEGQPMYRLPEFFEGTDVRNLFGEDVEPEDINNHACARALDKLYEAEPSTVPRNVLLRAAEAEDIDCSVLHADTTSFSVHGLYELDEDADDDTLEITHGYSTDNRRDLWQFKAGLGVNRAGVPVLGEILDGNANDKTWNTELIGRLDEWLDTDEPPIYVADSAAFTRSIINEAADHGIELITRVPRTHSAVDERIDRALEEDEWTEIGVLSDTYDEDDVGLVSILVERFEAAEVATAALGLPVREFSDTILHVRAGFHLDVCRLVVRSRQQEICSSVVRELWFAFGDVVPGECRKRVAGQCTLEEIVG